MFTYDPLYRVEVNLSVRTQHSDCGTSTYFLYYITVSTYCQDIVPFTTDHLCSQYSDSAALRSGVR